MHGLGDQPESWSQAFREALTDQLGGEAARVQLVDAYWAPLSTAIDTVRPRLAPGPQGTADMGLEDETYRRTVLEFSRMLAAESGATLGAHTRGPGDIFDSITSRIPGGFELVVDVGNYVARNGVRTAVQNVLHTCLGHVRSEGEGVPALVVSHSQGTVIAYDVLRQAGGSYPNLRTWITMGSPLRKYFAFPLEWGRQQLGLPPGLRWLNLYDPSDIVGRDLSGSIDWTDPQPEDRMVDNTGNARDAHDHWHNPQVVVAVAGEIVALLG
jgi:hypothetical protein